MKRMLNFDMKDGEENENDEKVRWMVWYTCHCG